MTRGGGQDAKPRVALVWDQFAPYHVDRCEAAARSLGGRADLLCVEIATASRRYAWPPSGPLTAARKHVLFPGRAVEDIGPFERWRGLYRALAGCDVVILGVPSSSPATIMLAKALQRGGSRVWFCSDSKADDYPRAAWAERIKSRLLAVYDGGIVAGSRTRSYYRGLGRSPAALLPGYATVSVARIRASAQAAALAPALGAASGPAPGAAESKPFVFVGRFVDKKALDVLLAAYAQYRGEAGTPRELVLVGDGPLNAALKAQAEELGIAEHLAWPGFLDAPATASHLVGAAALCLPSREEQWGLVVNEAVALGVPVIASAQVGATDLLVAHGVNGLVVETGSVRALADAFKRFDAVPLRDCPQDIAWLADSERFADAVEAIVFPVNPAVRDRIARMNEALDRGAGDRCGTGDRAAPFEA